MKILLFLLATFLASNSWAGDERPTYKHDPEDFQLPCEAIDRVARFCKAQQAARDCSDAEQADQAAVDRAVDAYKDFKKKEDELEAVKLQKDQQGYQAKYSAAITAIKNANDKWARIMQEREDNLKKIKARLLAQIKAIKDLSNENSEDGKTCRNQGHNQPAEHDDRQTTENKEQVVQPLADLAKGATPNPDKSESPIYKALATTLQKINKSTADVNSEIQAMRRRAAGLARPEAISKTRADNLKSAPNNKESTITGDPNKDRNSPQQQPSGGGSPPGGGSPGGDNAKSPSTVSDPTATPKPPFDPESPNPVANNSGKKFGEDSDKTNNKLDGKNPTAPNDGLPHASSSPEFHSPIFPGGSSTNSDALKDSTAAKLNPGGSKPLSGALKGGGGSAGNLGEGATSEKAADKAATAAGGSNPTNMAGGAMNSGGSGGSSDDVLSPFGKPLSDPKMTLAGSETDAAVKGLVGDLSPQANGQEGDRAPASEDEFADGIGDKNTISLFERMRAFHDRCAQKGCVAAGSKRKVGGG